MNIADKFLSMPIVTKNNKGEDIKTELKINVRLIGSYYEATHTHENNQETTVTYVTELGRQDIWGFPITINEFEKKLIPYLPLINSDKEKEFVFKEVPIRYKDEKQSQLLGKSVWVDEFSKFNFNFMTYYHPTKKVYNEEDGEIDVILFGIAGNGFYTMLSLEEFESIVK